MSFDMEPEDPHGECAAEIHALQAEVEFLSKNRAENVTLRTDLASKSSMLDSMTAAYEALKADAAWQKTEAERQLTQLWKDKEALIEQRDQAETRAMHNGEQRVITAAKLHDANLQVRALREAAERAIRGLESLSRDEAKRKGSTFEMCDYTFTKGLREALAEGAENRKSDGNWIDYRKAGDDCQPVEPERETWMVTRACVEHKRLGSDYEFRPFWGPPVTPCRDCKYEKVLEAHRFGGMEKRSCSIPGCPKPDHAPTYCHSCGGDHTLTR